MSKIAVSIGGHEFEIDIELASRSGPDLTVSGAVLAGNTVTLTTSAHTGAVRDVSQVEGLKGRA